MHYIKKQSPKEVVEGQAPEEDEIEQCALMGIQKVWMGRESVKEEKTALRLNFFSVIRQRQCLIKEIHTVFVESIVWIYMKIW